MEDPTKGVRVWHLKDGNRSAEDIGDGNQNLFFWDSLGLCLHILMENVFYLPLTRNV